MADYKFAKRFDGYFGTFWTGVQDGLATMEIIAAAYWSAGIGRPVGLPFAGPLELTPWELWQGPQNG